MDTRVINELFLFGVTLGWGPCLVSCSLALAPYLACTGTSWKEGLRNTLIFSSGRLISYILLGAIAGFSGKLISSVFILGNLPYLFKALSSLIILLFGITILFGRKSGTPAICGFIEKNNIKSLMALGLLIGLSPCAPFLEMLLYIILKSKNALDGAVYGMSFGIGTIFSPLLIIGAAAGYFPKILITNKNIYKWFQISCGISIVFYSFVMLYTLFIPIFRKPLM